MVRLPVQPDAPQVNLSDDISGRGHVVPPVTPQDTPQVERILELCRRQPLSRRELQSELRFLDRHHFQETYLFPAIYTGFLEMTAPDKPFSKLQNTGSHRWDWRFSKPRIDPESIHFHSFLQDLWCSFRLSARTERRPTEAARESQHQNACARHAFLHPASGLRKCVCRLIDPDTSRTCTPPPIVQVSRRLNRYPLPAAGASSPALSLGHFRELPLCALVRIGARRRRLQPRGSLTLRLTIA